MNSTLSGRACFRSICLPLYLYSSCATAEIIESTLTIPVQIFANHHLVVKQNVVVSVTRETAQAHAAVALIAHGRPASGPERLRMGQVKYPGNALWLAQQGFVVVVPTRIGYGVTGGPDLDYSGECADKNYLGAQNGALQQYRQVLDYLAKQPYVDGQRGILIGESFGGLTATAFAASKNTAGVLGVVNIAGGDGGDYDHLDQPCEPERLETTFALLGKKNHLPVLWMYSLNDRFWGPDYPRRWFQAYQAAGGAGEFVQLPADKNNGHFIFNRNVLAWHADLERFLVRLGFAAADQSAAAQH